MVTVWLVESPLVFLTSIVTSLLSRVRVNLQLPPVTNRLPSTRMAKTVISDRKARLSVVGCISKLTTNVRLVKNLALLVRTVTRRFGVRLRSLTHRVALVRLQLLN